MTRNWETSVTVKLISPSGDTLAVSAILERDPQHLKWNRMFLLGNKKQMLAVMKFHDDDFLSWEFFSRTDTGVGDLDPTAYRTSGNGILRSTGMSSGLNIADDSIQKIAEIEIHEFVESITTEGEKSQLAEFWFLQRPNGWHPSTRRIWNGEKLTRKGDWRSAHALNFNSELST